MFDPKDENERQAAIRRDREFNTLDPRDRLDWWHAASTPTELADKAAAEAAAEAHLTPAQREFMANKRELSGIGSPADLSEADAEMFEFLGTLGKPAQDNGSSGSAPASGGPIELDPVAIAAANLSPEHRVQIVESAETLKRAAAEAGLNPAVRRHTPAEVESARRWVTPYLKK